MLLFRLIPVVIALVPIVTINVCYLLAAYFEHVSWCIPYLDGCTSISATGRSAPESYVFRATILPLSIFLLIYWVLNYHWLLVLGDKKRWPAVFILCLGVISSICLILYTTVLGSIGDIFQLQRRIGATIYFSFTFLAQLIITSRLWDLKKQKIVATLGIVPEIQLLLCSTMFVVGLISIPLSVLAPDADNIIEWNFALLLYANFLPSYAGWKSTQFNIHYTAKID